MFPDLREVALCRKNPLGPSIMLSSDHQSWWSPYAGCVCSSGVVGLTTVGVLVGRAHPHFGWLRGLALYGGCLTHCRSK